MTTPREFVPTYNIWTSIDEAIAFSAQNGKDVTFKFNGVTVTVNSNSDRGLIHRDYQRATSGCIKKDVGPDPKFELSAEEIASDARITFENQRKYQQQQADIGDAARAIRAAADAKLATAPALKLSGPESWQAFFETSRDSYSQIVVDFAERWGRLMQIEIDTNKKTLEEVAESTSNEADPGTNSGATILAAYVLLTQYWVHGDQLKRLNETERMF